MQWAHTKRVTPSPSRAGGPQAPSLPLRLAAAMTATEASSSVLITDIIAFRATAAVHTCKLIFPAVHTDKTTVYPVV